MQEAQRWMQEALRRTLHLRPHLDAEHGHQHVPAIDGALVAVQAGGPVRVRRVLHLLQKQTQLSPVQSSPVRSSPVRSSLVQSGPVQSSPVRSNPVRSSDGSRCVERRIRMW
eukprot:1176772-Prorocentrum_minimum.AAC.1